MKHTPKIKHILYFCLGLFVLNACTLEEDVIKENAHQEKMKIETKSFKKLMKTNQFSNAMRKVPKKKVIITDALGRTILEEQYGFTIIDAPVKIVEFEGKVTYTIQIIKDDNTDNKIENLVLYETPIDEKIGYIVKYNSEKGISKTDEAIVEEGISELETLTTSGTILERTIIRISYLVSECTVSSTSPLYCGGDPNNPNFTAGCQHYEYDIITLEGGDGGGSNDGENGTGENNTGDNDDNDGTNGNNDTEGATSPVYCLECPSIPGGNGDTSTPCEKLKSIYAIENVREQHNELKTKLNVFNENGFDVQVIVTSTGVVEYNSEAAQAEICNQHSINWPDRPRRIGADHTHTIPGESYEVISGGDVVFLYQLQNSFNYPAAGITNDAFFSSMTVNDYTYAIKINDLQALSAKVADINTKKEIESLNNKFRESFFEDIGEPDEASQDRLVVCFLKFFKDYGITLYRRPINFNDWSKLELNSDQSNFTTTPCSN